MSDFSEKSESFIQVLEDEMKAFGLHYQYRCSTKHHPEKHRFIIYDYSGTYYHQDFEGDVIYTSLVAEIETHKPEQELIPLPSIAMDSFHYSFEAHGKIAGKDFHFDGKQEGRNCSMIWVFRSSEIKEDLLKPQREIVKSLAQIVRGQILLLAKKLGVEHPKPEPPKPVPIAEKVAEEVPVVEEPPVEEELPAKEEIKVRHLSAKGRTSGFFS